QRSIPQQAVLLANTHHPINPITLTAAPQADLPDMVDRATELPMVKGPMVDALPALVLRTAMLILMRAHLQRSTTLQALLVRIIQVHTDRHRGTNGIVSGCS